MLSATVKDANETPDCLASERFSGASTTNPESQNTGIDTNRPVTLMASNDRALPIQRRTVRAISAAPPIFSSREPIMAPAAITIPICPIVPPNPSVTASATTAPGKPAASPTSQAAISRTRKGWARKRAVATMTKTTAPTRIAMRTGPLSLLPAVRAFRGAGGAFRSGCAQTRPRSRISPRKAPAGPP